MRMTFTVVDLTKVDDIPATAAEIRIAEKAGRRAHREERLNAPGVDPMIRLLVGDTEVGDPRTLQLMSAFTTAYQECASAAAELAIGRPLCTRCTTLATGEEPDMGDDALTFAPGTCTTCRADGIVWTTA